MLALSEEDGYLVPSHVKQKINKKQTSPLFCSTSALSEEDGNKIVLPDVEPSPFHTLLIDKPQVIGDINTEYGELKNKNCTWCPVEVMETFGFVLMTTF